MIDSLRHALKQLRLSGLLSTLDVRLQEAAGHGLNHAEFLELVLQDELAIRSDRLLQRRVKAAGFREQKTLDDFDWSFNASIKKKQVFDLATGRFVREARDVLLLGPPGVGKSHLVQALAYQAVKNGFVVVLYRSIFQRAVANHHRRTRFVTAHDDLEEVLAGAFRQLLHAHVVDDQQVGLQVLAQDLVLDADRLVVQEVADHVEDWGKLIGDVPAATAILDRFLHHAEIIPITGKSYRLKGQGRAEEEAFRSPKRIGSRLTASAHL